MSSVSNSIAMIPSYSATTPKPISSSLTTMVETVTSKNFLARQIDAETEKANKAQDEFLSKAKEQLAKITDENKALEEEVYWAEVEVHFEETLRAFESIKNSVLDIELQTLNDQIAELKKEIDALKSIHQSEMQKISELSKTMQEQSADIAHYQAANAQLEASIKTILNRIASMDHANRCGNQEAK